MLSSTVMALMAKKGASSLMTHVPDSVEDKGDEQSSHPIVAPVEVELIDKEPEEAKPLKSGKGKDHKRHRKDSEGHHRPHHKKPRDLPKPTGANLGGSSSSSNAGSFSTVISAAKCHLDQLVEDFERLAVFACCETHEAELTALRRDLDSEKKLRTIVESNASNLLVKEKATLLQVEEMTKQVKALTADKAALEASVTSCETAKAALLTTISQLKESHEKTLAELLDGKKVLEDELSGAREALNKGAEEALHVLENGFKLCWDRAVKAGYDMKAHTFQKHCEDVARFHDGAGSSTRPDAPAI